MYWQGGIFFATINGVTQSYDAAGNLTGNGSTTWTYNARGRLVSAKLANATVYNYGINGLGQRVSKSGTAVSTGRQIYVYDEAGHLIGEYNNSGARVWEHIYLGDLPVAVIASGGGVFPVLSDHLGTPRQIINASKQLRWQWDNTEPFGANAANQNPAGFGVFAYNLRFPGQYFDVETGLHYNYFRDYNPQTGRYVESDPIGLSGGLNTFGYARNNPLRFIDPSGHIAVVDDAIIIGGGAAAVTACIAMNCGQGVVDTASKVADAVSDAMHDALDNIYEMSKSGQTSKGTNWATEAAKVKTQEDGQDPCYWLAKWLAEAKASGDKKRVGDLIEAEKYMDCRNKDKRKNKYRCE